jgi:hypothetical protein
MHTSNPIIHQVQAKIKHTRTDTIWNHIITALERDPVHFSGIVGEDHFVIWQTTDWTGVFYPVVYGKADSSNKNGFVLTAKINSFGKLLLIVIGCGWMYAWFSYYPPRFNPWNFGSVFIGLAFVTSVLLLLYGIYRQGRIKMVAEISELLSQK